jgi:hypothetical protein
VSDWDRELGRMDFEGICHSSSILNAIAQLSTNLDPHNYDLSIMGPGEHVVGEMPYGDWGEEEEMELGLQTPVNSMSLLFFCRQLVLHFLIMFLRNLIKWPQNRKGKPIIYVN